MKHLLTLLALPILLAVTTAFSPAPPTPGCNDNLAKAALLSYAPFQDCASTHRAGGIAFSVSASQPRNGQCTYDVYAFDPFRCPPGQICPLVLIAPFAHATVDADYNVTLLECFNY